MSVIVLASTDTLLKCPEGGEVGLLMFQTIGEALDPELCQLLCPRRSQPLGHEQQPGKGPATGSGSRRDPASRKGSGREGAWSAGPSPSPPNPKWRCPNLGRWLAGTCPYAWRAA